MRYRIHETGEERWALVRGTPVHDDEGAVAYAINIFRDVTDTQHAEERLHAALALEYVADGVFLLDVEGVIRFWNPAAEAITGLTAVEVVGRSAAAAIPGWAAIAELVAAGPAGRPATRAARAGRARGLAVDRRRQLRGGHRLRLPRPDRGAWARPAEDRLRLDGLARAAHAAGGDLRGLAHAAPRRHRASGRAARHAARGDRQRGRPPRPDRERHPLGEPTRLRNGAA